MIKRIQFTLNESLLEVWPSDRWSRDNCHRLMGNYQLGYDYIPTTMGTSALRFRNLETYEQALTIIKNYAEQD